MKLSCPNAVAMQSLRQELWLLGRLHLWEICSSRTIHKQALSARVVLEALGAFEVLRVLAAPVVREASVADRAHKQHKARKLRAVLKMTKLQLLKHIRVELSTPGS